MPPDFDGELFTSEALRRSAAVDFGGVVHKVPDAVLRPGSTEDIATAMRWMSEQGKRVTAQGRRHSVFGRSQVDDGLVIDMSAWNGICAVRDGTVVVDAGATWSDVLRATLPAGLTPPVLTEYLELSVGGTVVVGGVGGTTWRRGVQSDNVLELEVVTGDGHVLTCSPGNNTRLFDALRAGLGQLGVITRARLALDRAPESARRYQLTYPDLDTMLADQRVLLQEERWDYLGGAVLPREDGGWTYMVDGSALFSGEEPDDGAMLVGLRDERARAQITTLPYAEYVHRFAPLETALRTNGQWFHPHPWLNTFVGDSVAHSVITAELDALTPADLGTFGRALVFPVQRASVRSPLMQMPDESLAFAFNLLRYPTTDSPETAAAMVDANRAVYERVRAAGGTLNPVSAFPMSARDWRRHFGAHWELLSSAKEAYDPKRVLTPGYELF